MSAPITVALAKGRLQEVALELFARGGVVVEAPEESRRLWLDDASGRYRFVLVKPGDVPTYVEYGVADCGVCGQDVLLESGADVLAPLDLDVGKCRLAVASRRGNATRLGSAGVHASRAGSPTPVGAAEASATRGAHAEPKEAWLDASRASVRVATKYPRTTTRWFHDRGLPVEVIPLSGSVELAPVLGLADHIVDLVETGRTLEENGLEVLETIAHCSARLVVNRAAWQLRGPDLRALVETLRAARDAKGGRS